MLNMFVTSYLDYYLKKNNIRLQKNGRFKGNTKKKSKEIT